MQNDLSNRKAWAEKIFDLMIKTKIHLSKLV